jgi:hypothetical protein
MGMTGMTRIVGKGRVFPPLPQCIGAVGFTS